MALEEKSLVDSINTRIDGQIEVRTATVIEKDGVEIAISFSSHVVVPGADLANEDARVKSIAEVVHTEEVINAYKAKIGS